MWYGKNKYTLTPPGGSVLGTSLRIVRFAGKGNWGKPKYLSSDGFWNKAKPSTIPEASRPKWMTFDDGESDISPIASPRLNVLDQRLTALSSAAYVDEVRRGLKACKVFCWYPL